MNTDTAANRVPEELRDLGDIHQFLDQIFAELQRQDIDVSLYEMDHMCYRCASISSYLTMKAKLERTGALLLTEANIGGRPIASFELRHPIHYQGRVLGILELPQPKPNVVTAEGLEHVEFVIKESFDEFLAKYPGTNFDLQGREKTYNPEIALAGAGFQIKFHRQSLKSCIEDENRG